MTKARNNFTAEQEQLFKETFGYDPETGMLFRLDQPGVPVGFDSGYGYLRVYLRGANPLAHRLAWFLHYGEWPGLLDHADRNRKNNKLSNLRPATQSQNSSNTGFPPRGKSGYRGVAIILSPIRAPRYRAQVDHQGKTRKGPKRLNPFDAAQDYDRMARELHGEFAVTNADLGLLQNLEAA